MPRPHTRGRSRLDPANMRKGRGVRQLTVIAYGAGDLGTQGASSPRDCFFVGHGGTLVDKLTVTGLAEGRQYRIVCLSMGFRFPTVQHQCGQGP